MPQKKNGAPITWYIFNIIAGVLAALYVRYAGTDTGRENLTGYGAGLLVCGFILIAAGSKMKSRSMPPLGVGALVFGACALFL